MNASAQVPYPPKAVPPPKKQWQTKPYLLYLVLFGIGTSVLGLLTMLDVGVYYYVNLFLPLFCTGVAVLQPCCRGSPVLWSFMVNKSHCQ
jgi:hypothetical protein